MPINIHNMENTQHVKNTLPTSADWATAPDLAQWFAIDENGDGYWYECKPSISDNCLWSTGRRGKVELAGRYNSTNWKKSLQSRPQQ